MVFTTFTIAGIVKGVTGMGLPTVAMGVLGLFMPPVLAAGLLILPSFVTNIWQLLAGPDFRAIVARLWPMMIAIAAGTLIGIRLMTAGTGIWTTSALGLCLAVYAAYSLFAKPLSVPARLESSLSPAIGLTTGLLTGGTGIFVVPAVPYIQSLGFNRDDLVQALGLSFTVSTIALAASLASQDAFRVEHLSLSALAVLPALLGMWLGQKIRNIVSPATFRRWFLICLLLLGAELFLRAFW
ncbi:MULTISPECIES: sulfite exporter TauE/SafE family protein [unclassified Agrobacterium]|uniref:sulfite exporter TauE/SafE family protein n=1 Tax=unclassified Agrobacterium TaxID=2632611 RepID=UPI002448CC56|nr:MULTISPECIES: sulfite exporter TauE/SafE family protein [unclassified Agrobacterium]MDH0615714.1 sulfite exporter TauE/SafE family protein [Agrobacterium sp. GD03872]MDH0697932.1 sulfite exporter TauE/SafE family protein [Agrobacterium sp. GD03871]MDH1061647.1 sulfite exporter TauE/SafE family protein [Agrobacterium sp. GD03992]MDH2211106.1 sulfite exporter TauE/SafE family protein [Agrobacterium sp. GD03643]MDH2221748.1 sulfite exporter TauE/SafE family protein [Agrobacterium sp. GD03638]